MGTPSGAYIFRPNGQRDLSFDDSSESVFGFVVSELRLVRHTQAMPLSLIVSQAAATIQILWLCRNAPTAQCGGKV